jgi:phosphate transport system protein
MNTHFSSQFDLELDAVRAQLTQMGGLVEQQLQHALQAVASHDVALVDRVVAGDKEVDALELSIDEACTHIIAKRQPAAIDLRVLLAIIKVVRDLERMGDEAKKIAKAVRKINELGMVGPFAHEVDLRHVGDQVLAMVHAVLDAFVRSDADGAADIVRKDRDIDALYRATARQLVTYMMEDPRTISTSLDLMFIAKSIERIGDHAKNIAEHVIYISKGRDVRHKGLAGLDEDVDQP